MTNISVTAVGAVTSVGYDAATACASIRAGISRPSVIDEFEVLDAAAQEPIGLTAHPLGEATRGFSGVGRWLQMAAMALRDLANDGSIPGTADRAFWSSTICYVVLPFLDPRRFDPTGTHGSEEALRASFVTPLLRRCESFFAPAETVLLPRGRIGSLHAILLAARRLSEGRFERGLVLAVDSLTDEPALLWLAERGRLKEDDNPVGLSPGEAAVSFLVEHTDAAVRRRARPIAGVAAVATARESNVFIAGDHSLGEGIADVVQRVLAEADVPIPYRSDVLTDLNGESWRSTEYGNARIRVPSQLWQGHRIAMPASSVGDVGAAMTALELLVACHSVERGYAAGRHVMLMSSDEYGDVGAAVLREEG